MGYSKITSVEVTNFMVYRRAKISFDERNILNIKGYNSSGKSTMLKAIGVCLMNMYPRSQTKLIRHGEDYFRVVVSFSDGVSILRDKYANGQSLYEMYKDNVCIFTTKEGKKLSKIEDVPAPIQAYLGLCVTSFGYLNYQSRQDKLWLVETTGSENYTSLNEILKSEEIARANALINSDKNKLQAEISEIEGSLQAVRLEKMSASAYTQELLTALEGREAMCKALMAQYAAVERMYDSVVSMMEIRVAPYVDVLDASRICNIAGIQSYMKSIESTVVSPEVVGIDYKRLHTLEGMSLEADKIQHESRSYAGAEMSLISMKPYIDLVSIANSMKALSEVSSGIKRYGAECEKLSKKLASAIKVAEDSGVHFVKCANCGSYTEVTE